LRRAPAFVKAAGGAPANVAVAAARLGLRAGFMGAVGRDEFGYFLRETLESNGVDVRGLCHPARGATPLAFVSLKEDAERDFLFYWQNTADQFIDVREAPVALAGQSRIFHYGSIGLIHPAMRRLTRSALRAAAHAGNVFVSCDPNLRLNLWPSAAEARRAILQTIGETHLVKINEDELMFLTDSKSLPRAMKALAESTDAAILVTLGGRGAAYRWRKNEGEVAGFRVNAVDSTGAGDGFVAGFLSQIAAAKTPLCRLEPDAQTLDRWIRYANAVGALATTKRGAIPSFPLPAEVSRLLRKQPRELL
jgi:fructokinase